MASGAAKLKMATACMLVLLLGQVLIMANPAVAEDLEKQMEFWKALQTIQWVKEMKAHDEATKACDKKCDEDAKKQAEESGRTADANEHAGEYYLDCANKCYKNT
ncbi:hypothetical protein ACP4OV_006724 [Aristida adscensionis]